jgi:hypothetical protein
LLLRFAFFELRGSALARPRGNTTWPFADHGRVANGERFFVRNAYVFGDSSSADRRSVQEPESALDWSGSDGWPRLGYCD